MPSPSPTTTASSDRVRTIPTTTGMSSTAFAAVVRDAVTAFADIAAVPGTADDRDAAAIVAWVRGGDRVADAADCAGGPDMDGVIDAAGRAAAAMVAAGRLSPAMTAAIHVVFQGRHHDGSILAADRSIGALMRSPDPGAWWTMSLAAVADAVEWRRMPKQAQEDASSADRRAFADILWRDPGMVARAMSDPAAAWTGTPIGGFVDPVKHDHMEMLRLLSPGVPGHPERARILLDAVAANHHPWMETVDRLTMMCARTAGPEIEAVAGQIADAWRVRATWGTESVPGWDPSFWSIGDDGRPFAGQDAAWRGARSDMFEAAIRPPGMPGRTGGRDAVAVLSWAAFAGIPLLGRSYADSARKLVAGVQPGRPLLPSIMATTPTVGARIAGVLLPEERDRIITACAEDQALMPVLAQIGKVAR